MQGTGQAREQKGMESLMHNHFLWIRIQMKTAPRPMDGRLQDPEGALIC